MIICPACTVMLQPLSPGSAWLDSARQLALTKALSIPTHGPSALVFLALVAHAMVLHPELDLLTFLEAYLDS